MTYSTVQYSAHRSSHFKNCLQATTVTETIIVIYNNETILKCVQEQSTFRVGIDHGNKKNCK